MSDEDCSLRSLHRNPVIDECALLNENKISSLAAATKSYRHFLWLAFLFSVFVNILMLTGPLFMLQVYDRVLGSRSEETLVALLILVLGLYGLMWLLDFARTRLLARCGARFQAGLNDRVFEAQIGQANRTPQAQSASRDLEVVQSF